MNISNKNINKKKQAQPQGRSSAAPAASKAKTIKLGVDVHLALFVVTRIIDGSTPQPAQRFKPAQFLLWCAKPLRQAEQLFTGRDHSWMQFNRRVLEEAEDPSNPLLERVKFLAITGSNLDEYVEVRQAGLMQRIEDGYREPGYDGLRPDESLAVLTAEIHTFVDAQYRCWNEQLLPELRKQRVRLLEWEELDEEARAFAQGYFQREVDPLLTPISIDPAHPFPRVLNKALCLALLLRRKRRSSGPQVLGVVTVPRALPRFVRLPADEGKHDYMLLQDLIAQNLAGMYRGYEVLARAAFRVTRNSNLYFEEEEARSLLETIRVELHNGRKE